MADLDGVRRKPGLHCPKDWGDFAPASPRTDHSGIRNHQHPAVDGVCAPVLDKVSVPHVVSAVWLFAGVAVSVKVVAVVTVAGVMLYLTAVPVAPLGDTADTDATVPPT